MTVQFTTQGEEKGGLGRGNAAVVVQRDPGAPQAAWVRQGVHCSRTGWVGMGRVCSAEGGFWPLGGIAWLAVMEADAATAGGARFRGEKWTVHVFGAGMGMLKNS